MIWKVNYKKRGIVTLTLSSLIGFAAGGAIGGALWVAFDAPHIGFAVMGAAGGAVLGVMIRGWRKAWVVALAGAIGYDVGFLAGFFIPLTIWEPGAATGLFIGATGGAIGGAAIGAVLKSWRKTGISALASAIGFGLAAWLTWDSFRGMSPQVLSGILTLTAWGAAGGACLGLALGWLQKGDAAPPET